MKLSAQLDSDISTDLKIEARVTHLLQRLASLDRFGIAFLRGAIVVILLWIGALKFVPYEADSIVPLVANSPAMSFLYHSRGSEYRQYMNREGPAHRRWHTENGTYPVSYGLGVAILSIAMLIALHPLRPLAAVGGSFLLILMMCTTLSFLFTTPEAWVPALGDSTHGFPFLSGLGRLIIKDLTMLGAAIVTLADSARAELRRRLASGK